MRTTTRRAVLGTGITIAGSGLLTACTGSSNHAGHSGRDTKPSSAPGGDYVSPNDREVADAEAKRNPGPERRWKTARRRRRTGARR
ncbi:hypothetical protein ACFWHF_03955 [Streptomyces griseoincarnatus]